MKRQLLFFLFMLALFAAEAGELCVCTYNVRYKNSGDTDAGNGWNTRRTYLINFVNFQQPDLLGVQEATNAQMNDMASGLTGYSYIGVGRTDGGTSGEYSAIFYRKERMVLLDHGDFWLSDTPGKPSKGFPSAGGSTTYYRICTWGKFYDKEDSVIVYHFNTHMDLDEKNRQQSYYLIKQKVEELASRTAPVIITGDYNAIQTGEAYKLFYNSGFLYDCYDKAKQKFMTNGTCPGFDAGNYSTVESELRRIDHIFVTKTAFNIMHYAVLNPCYYSTSGTATYYQRAYSDHSPVLAKLAYRTTVPKTELAVTPPPLENGVYQLSTPQDLLAFSYIVGGIAGYRQNAAAKAVLLEDIDMTGATGWQPIGSVGKPFTGTFDGQSHAIRNITIKTGKSYGGLIGNASGATIKNFTISGSLVAAEGFSEFGAVGYAAGSAIEDVHSSLTITIPKVSTHIGGVVGSLCTGSTIRRCSFSGSISDTGGSTDCIGGVVGYTNENCIVENCANYGKVTFRAAEAFAGGIIGYVNNASFAGLKNCLSVGKVGRTSGTPTYSGAIGGRIREFTPTAFLNNYWLEGSAIQVSGENAVEGEAVSADRLASGEICYRLNGDQTSISWYQTLGEDDYPVLLPDHLPVLLQDGTYVNDDTDGIKDLIFKQGSTVVNLAGQRLMKVQKGINIINGKKYIQQ
ncbi:MAG: endonuclease/exonuclease/phosphatase family protein [Bacteroidaceae bacterium]|nr:endonuclease/exonuclease/phosphatase family protein [Bacteroidaceae bacterium]